MTANFDPAWSNFNGLVHECTFEGCSRKYKYAKSCFDHYRNAHLPAPKFPCPHCHHEFSKQKTLNTHLKSNACKAKRVEVWNLDEARTKLLDRSTKRTQLTDPMRRNRIQPKPLPEPVARLLAEYENWEKSPIGDLHRPKRLAALTLQGYKSHIKKWLEYVVGLVEASKEDANWQNNLADLLLPFCEVGHSQDFMTATFAIQGAEIRSIDTIRNYCWAMMRWTKFCLSRIAAKDARFAKVRQARVEELYSWAQKTSAAHATEARHNQMLRNNLDHLMENNRWIDYSKLLEVHDKMSLYWEEKIDDALRKELPGSVLEELGVFAQLTFFLKEVPLRAQNLYNLELGNTICWQPDSKTYKVKYHDFKSMNANLPPYSPVLSEHTSAILRKYEDFVRPQLFPTTNYFFINQKGLAQTSLSTRMSIVMKRRTGVDGITPGKIRAAIATAAKQEDLPREQREKLARSMLHSFATHETQYAKVSAQADHVAGRSVVANLEERVRQRLGLKNNRLPNLVTDESIDESVDDLIDEAFCTSVSDSEEELVPDLLDSRTNSNKRKRPNANQYEDVLLDNKRLQVDDVVVINPDKSQSKESFWLGIVKEIINGEKIKIQWLDRQRERVYKRLDSTDWLESATFEKVADGQWLNDSKYKLTS